MSVKEVKIRKLTEKDLLRVREIDLMLAGEGRALSWPLGVGTEWSLSVYRPIMSFVAQKGDEIIGFLLGDMKGPEYGLEIGGWIDMMGIAPRYQQQGVGRKLVDAFCEECESNDIKPNVIIREDDEQLTNFWASLGFRRGKLISFEK